TAPGRDDRRAAARDRTRAARRAIMLPAGAARTRAADQSTPDVHSGRIGRWRGAGVLAKDRILAQPVVRTATARAEVRRAWPAGAAQAHARTRNRRCQRDPARR